MNKLQYSLLVIIGFSLHLFSCSQPRVGIKELVLAENLMQEHPDNALLVLESIRSPEKMDKADYAGYCLLLTEAQENYLRAVPLAQKENNYPLLLRTHNQSGELYRNRKIYDRALSSLHEALKHCRVAGDQKNLPYCLRDIGRVHLFTGETDSTIYYYRQAIDETRVNNDIYVEYTISEELAIAYKTKGRYRDCSKIIEKVKRKDRSFKSFGVLYPYDVKLTFL